MLIGRVVQTGDYDWSNGTVGYADWIRNAVGRCRLDEECRRGMLIGRVVQAGSSVWSNDTGGIC